MDAQRWRRIEDLFFAAMEQEESARPSFLEVHCDGDAELRSEVQGMLEAEGKAAVRLAGAVGGAVRSLSETIPMGSRIGAYEILQTIGEGGMGVVYRASRGDDVFKKDVAIKIVKRGMDTDAILRRFRHERRILASLEHPYIARVLDGGSTESGLPYLVMEYVDGKPITDYSNDEAFGLHERLKLFQKVCEAVEYAHRSLIVHRDLKPSNILVDKQGNPRLLDFGIAKILDETDSAVLLTTVNQRLFTPAYASPEQVKGEPVTVASDVYCLGIVLYELLTNCTAHTRQSVTPAAALQAVCQSEIRPPSQAARYSNKLATVAPEKLRGDLDRIVLMAVEKEPRLRYGSIEQFSSDLRNFLESRPVVARPQTVRYRAMKFARRNRGILAASSVIALSLVGGTAYSTYQARRAEARFQQVRKLANTFVFDVHDAIQPLAGSTKARQLLVSTGLQYLDSLAAEADRDPDLQWELAQAYAKLGNVQGSPRAGPHLGDTAGALSSQRKAVSLLRQLARKTPDDLKVLRALVASNQAVGDLEVHAGNRSQAVNAFAQTLETAQRIVTHSQHEPRDLRLRALALVRIGNQQLAQGESASAVTSLEAAVEDFQAFAKSAPTAQGQPGVAYGLQYLGQAYGGRGDIERAAQTYRQAIQIREQLVNDDPKNLATRRELSVAYSLLADQLFSPLQFSTGNRDAALPLYRKALAICEEASAADLNTLEPNAI
jgi:serine/threonine protein kinase/tetratricopeptide (TPR) repeat protein